MNIKTALQEVTKDRVLMASWLVFALLSIATTIIFAFRIHPSELNTQIHYSAFGVIHIYSNAWYYLLPTVLFGVVILALHTVIATKLCLTKNNHIARLFVWLSVIVVIVAAFIASSVLGLASIQR